MNDLDNIRTAAIDRIERSARNYRLAFLGAVMFEGVFLAAFLFAADLHNRLHVLLLMATVGSYTLIVLGLVALGAYLDRGTLRVLKAVELLAAGA
jgi:hypothetical protein